MTCEIKGEIRNGLVLSRKDSELLHYHGCIFFFLALSFNVCHIVWQKSRSFLLACNNFIIVFNKLFWFCVNHSVMFNSLQPHGLYSARLLCPWDPLGKNTAPGFYFLLQGIFPTQESNPGLLRCSEPPGNSVSGEQKFNIPPLLSLQPSWYWSPRGGHNELPT